MISLVITSCGRVELLKRTIASFLKYNDIPISEVILIDDSGDIIVKEEIEKYFNLLGWNVPVNLLFNAKNIGQVKSIDIAYSRVKQPYIFHLENDWEFICCGFMSKSLTILDTCPNVLTVWLRGLLDTNTHPVDDLIYNTLGVDFRLMSVNALGGSWHGFTWNPGLRRTIDYKNIGTFADFIYDNDFAALTECRIGQWYYERGFRAATLLNKYVKHIG
jgi:hypothetical protein